MAFTIDYNGSGRFFDGDGPFDLTEQRAVFIAPPSGVVRWGDLDWFPVDSEPSGEAVNR